MTISPKKTTLQTNLENQLLPIRSALTEADIDVSAIDTYIDIVNTPRVSDLITLINAIETIKSLTESTIATILLNAVENLALIEFASLKIGNPQSNLILTGSQYPSDDLGVTYATILADLLINLAVPENVDTADDLASTIFYTVNALDPELTLENLQADIQATIAVDVGLEDLTAQILASLGDIDTATSLNIRDAIYGGNILPVDTAHLMADIQEKENLLNLNTITASLREACGSGTADEFAQSIYDSLLDLSSHLLSLERLEKDVAAGIANVGSLDTLKSNILENLNGIADLYATAALIDDAVFAEDGLIPSNPHDLSIDLPPANSLLILQHITAGLESATASFSVSGDASDLANAILSAITANGGGETASLDELVNDIEASGDLGVLADNINSALGELDLNLLTPSMITDALYGDGLIISGHKQNLIDDLIVRQTLVNYYDMIEPMSTAITASTNATTLANAIYNNVGTSHDLSLNDLTADITATIAAGNIGALKSALSTALGSVTYELSSAESIVAALYGDGLIIPAHPSELAADIRAAETAIDYRTLITQLKAVCDLVTGNSPTITTASAFATALSSTLNTFSSITPTLDTGSVESDINDIISDGSSLVTIAGNIKTALTTATFDSLSIDSAIFNSINPSHANSLNDDAVITERFMNLYEIKNSITGACDAASTNATEFAIELVAAVQNENNNVPTLGYARLAADIEATLVLSNVTLTELADDIKDTLDGISVNALTSAGIENAVYNTGGVMSANPYEMALDITAREFTLGYQGIKESLIAYLQPIYIISGSEVDISSITLARGILDVIDTTAYNISSALTPTRLSACISYTISSHENEFTENYMLAEALVETLELINDDTITAQNIADAVFNAETILITLGDTFSAGRLLSYIEAVDAAELEFADISLSIQESLGALTGSYTKTSVANAIVDGIDAYVPNLSATSLLENLVATGAGASTIVSNLISSLNATTVDSADDIVNVIFAVDGGILASSTVSAGNLLADINTSIGASNDFSLIISNIVSNLGALSINYVADDVADAIFHGLDKIADGNNILNPSLLSQQILDDINTTLEDSDRSLATLVTNLITRLSALTGGSVSATGISDAIYNNVAALMTATTNADDYKADLEAAAAAHSSLSVIQNNFAVNTYNGINSLSDVILNGIKSGTGITTSLSSNELTADITYTTNNNYPLTLLVSDSIFSAVYNGNLSVDAMVNGIFGDNIQTGLNADLLKQDLVAYELSRESTYYSTVSAGLWGHSLAFLVDILPGAFAGGVISLLTDPPSKWTSARLLEDVEATIALGNGHTINDVANYFDSLIGNVSFTSAAAIADAIYSDSGLALSTADAGDLTADINVDTALVYGGANSIATNVLWALGNLTSPYNETDVATAIIETITPTLVNDDPNLSVDSMVADLLYTEDFTSVSLTTLVGNIEDALTTVAGNSSATAGDLDDAIYSGEPGLIIPSDDDEENFQSDIESATAAYNQYAVIQNGFAAIYDTSATAAAGGVLGITQLPSNRLNQTELTTDITNSLGDSTIGTFIAMVKGVMEEVDVSNSTTAPLNLATAFFSENTVIPVNLISLGTDITNADEIDNAVTITSALGSSGVCRSGATHTVYSCNANGDVSAVIATNDCTTSGAIMAERACDRWASQTFTDFYLSYDGVECTDYLGALAASYCKAGLDLILG